MALHSRVRTLVHQRVRRAHNKGTKGVITGVGSLMSFHVVGLLCRTSRTQIRVSLVIQKVYYLQPKLQKVDSGVHIVDVVNRFLRRSHVFCFRGSNRPRCCVNDTS